MDKPIDNYWKLRMADLKTALESNNFDVHLADDRQAACKVVLEDIMPQSRATPQSTVMQSRQKMEN